VVAKPIIAPQSAPKPAAAPLPKPIAPPAAKPIAAPVTKPIAAQQPSAPSVPKPAVPQRPGLVLSAAVPIKAQPDDKTRLGKKSKRSADQRANRKARKAERMAKKRAERRAAAEQSNAEHNPRRTTKLSPDVRQDRAPDDSSNSQSRAPEPDRPVRRGSDKVSRTSNRAPRERSTRSRIAIGVLLALGLMLGFWLLFKLPAN